MNTTQKWRRLLSCLLALALLLTAAPFAPAQAASSKEIQEELDELKEQGDELQAQIDDLEGKLDENMSQMEALVAQKNVLEQQLFLLRQQQENIRQQINVCNLLIAQKQKELDEAQARLDALKEDNKERIRSMEMYGSLSYWSVLAQANSIGDLLDRVSMIHEIQQADERHLQELAEAANAVEQAQQELRKEKDALEKTQQTLAENQRQMEEKAAQIEEILIQLIATGEEYEQWLEKMEDEQTELLHQIAQTEKELNQALDKEQQSSRPDPNGKPPSSVTDGVTWLIPINYWYLSSPYGMRDHPIEGIRKFHHGVDLAAPEGTPIYASRSGRVTAATYGSANGYYVTINHGDGFTTMYLHMTHYTVSAGQWVEAGQKIGECGNTGASKGNHLHFGVYYNGSSVNPAEYIDFY